jgi:hypothetical protein
MAIIANTFQTTVNKANRESLADDISMITPRETPAYSGMSKGSMTATFDEWIQRTLRAPAANAQLEGDVYTYNAFTPSVRVGNYSQIVRDSAIFTRTQDKVKNAGNSETTERAKLEVGLALRKDVELQIVSNTASVSGATRVSGGLPSWLTTNVSRGVTGANGGYNTGTKLTVAETLGTQRALTQTLLDDNLQAVYQSGGDVSDIMLSPYLKRVFVTFMSNPNVAVFRHPVESGSDNRIISNAEYYDGPHGTVKVIQNRVMGLNAATARRSFLIDWSMLAYKWLRPISEDPEVTINADARAFVLVGEGSLEVRNEAGLGVIADLFGMTAST